MDKKPETNKILIITLIFILLISIIGLIFYKNLTKDTEQTITVTVKYKTNDYIIVIDDNNIEYKLNKTNNIKENDILKITINNINDKTTPITANIKELNIISKSISFTIEDNTKIEDKDNND